MKKLLVLLCLVLSNISYAQISTEYAGLTRTYPPVGLEPNPIPTSTCNPTGSCPPVGDPYIGDCFAGLERYLARSIEMDGLAEMNLYEPGWVDPCNSPGWACNNYPNNCNHGGYCPARYCEEIQMAVNVKASMLLSVAGVWGRDNWKKPGSFYLNTCAQAVRDINRAYDCAGLRRPIIGANITEQVDYSVDQVEIPRDIIKEFDDAGEFTAYEKLLYKQDPINFSTSRICVVGTPPSGSGKPDLLRVEARMYFYYMARLYINVGYKQLYSDYLGNAAHYYVKGVHDVVNRVRQYAASKNTFVLVSGTKSDFFYIYSGNLIFDYRATASRPLEVPQPGCAPTANINTVITPNADNAPMYTHGGVGPYTNCNYSDANFGSEARVPFAVGIDMHEGEAIPPDNVPNGPIGDYAAAWWVWGYDEARWLDRLSTSCEADWLDYAYKAIKGISHRAAFNMPGRKTLNRMPSGPTRQFYRMYENPTLQSRLINDTWHTNSTPTFSYSVTCNPAQVNLWVTNPDASTVYTWHIQRPDGSWEPYTYNTTRFFYPTMNGTYTIGVRCDNLGYAPSTFGTIIPNTTINITCVPLRPEGETDEPPVINRFHTNGIIESSLNVVEKGTVTANEYGDDVVTNIEYLQSNYSSLIIYPNPTNQSVNVQWNSTINELQIVDVVGRVKKSIKASANEGLITNIDVSDLANGVYYMKVRTDKETQTKSFIVQH